MTNAIEAARRTIRAWRTGETTPRLGGVPVALNNVIAGFEAQEKKLQQAERERDEDHAVYEANLDGMAARLDGYQDCPHEDNSDTHEGRMAATWQMGWDSENERLKLERERDTALAKLGHDDKAMEIIRRAAVSIKELGLERETLAEGREHLTVTGKFQSDKYPWCPAGFVPLKVSDPMAQDPLLRYAERRREVDAAFADDLVDAVSNTAFSGAKD